MFNNTTEPIFDVSTEPIFVESYQQPQNRTVITLQRKTTIQQTLKICQEQHFRPRFFHPIITRSKSQLRKIRTFGSDGKAY